MGAEYSDTFLADMDLELGAHYRSWLPWCREAVDLAVGRLTAPEHLVEVLGIDPARHDLEALSAAWVRPFRSYLERSGKLLRPYLVTLCMEAYGRDPRSRPLLVGLAEIIHSSSLMLDDVVDDSLLRRGAPTAHRQHGVRVAGASASAWLNLGAALAWIERAEHGPALDELLRELAWEHFVTGLGTTIDVTWAWRRNRDFDPDEYLQQVIHRSTSYTYRLPLKIGGVAAGAPPEDRARLAAFGEQVGLAFQLVDDVLNVRPGDDAWGKEVAEDIAQGKFSLQVILALRRAGPGERERLLSILGSGTHDQALLEEAVGILDRTGSLATCLAKAEDLMKDAFASVEGLAVEPVYKRRLHHLARYVVRRSR